MNIQTGTMVESEVYDTQIRIGDVAGGGFSIILCTVVMLISENGLWHWS